MTTASPPAAPAPAQQPWQPRLFGMTLKKKQKLFVVEPKDGVTFVGRSLFRASIALPANVPVGPLVARADVVQHVHVHDRCLVQRRVDDAQPVRQRLLLKLNRLRASR